MSQSALDCLPEIQDLIYDRVTGPDLYALCLVNQRCRRHAEPFLYSNISWTWNFQWTSPKLGPVNTKIPPITSFLMSILKRPQLATFVHGIALEGDSLSGIPHYFRGKPPSLAGITDEQLRAVSEAVDKLKISQDEKDQWTAELKLGTMGAYVALLLSCLPNLKSLWLGENFVRDAVYLGKILNWNLRAPAEGGHTLLQKLSTAHIQLAVDWRYRDDSSNTMDQLSLFYLPLIEKISTSIDNPVEALSWPALEPPCPSKLTSLDIGMLREGSMGQILSVTTEVRDLRWRLEYCMPNTHYSVAIKVDLSHIAADLSHVRRTLTNLTISADWDTYEGDLEPSGLNLVGSLAPLSEFDALQTLELPLPFLVASMSPDRFQPIIQSLPRNLIELVITDDLYLHEDYDWLAERPMEAIRPWMENWKAFSPHLQRVHFLIRLVDFEDWGPQMRQELEDLGERVGLPVKITKLLPPN